ncbi:hypothetical protein BV25DRAFT_1839033 [Artomyces pyxidatus]|uniref:Uncharacterized protein n=1 Tax=Artomyces pyxidatus TaxID=48021 RepID=A0ACB8SZE6_9AGAM|nr:hypothetical protein BV25DRAFT_1839033 [Artomyces pyxidatus]
MPTNAHEVTHDGITSYFSNVGLGSASLRTPPKIGDVFYTCGESPSLHVRGARRWRRHVWQTGEGSEVVHPIDQDLVLTAGSGGAPPRWHRKGVPWDTLPAGAMVGAGLVGVLRELAEHGVRAPMPTEALLHRGLAAAQDGGDAIASPMSDCVRDGRPRVPASSRPERTARIIAAQGSFLIHRGCKRCKSKGLECVLRDGAYCCDNCRGLKKKKACRWPDSQECPIAQAPPGVGWQEPAREGGGGPEAKAAGGSVAGPVAGGPADAGEGGTATGLAEWRRLAAALDALAPGYEEVEREWREAIEDWRHCDVLHQWSEWERRQGPAGIFTANYSSARPCRERLSEGYQSLNRLPPVAINFFPRRPHNARFSPALSPMAASWK